MIETGLAQSLVREWIEPFLALCAAENVIKWDRGDMLVDATNAGEDVISAVLDAAEEAGVSMNVLTTERWVSRTFPQNERHTDLTWTHHRLVSAIEPGDYRHKLLDQCAENGWSASYLRTWLTAMSDEEAVASLDKATTKREFLEASWRIDFPSYKRLAEPAADWAIRRADEWDT